MSAVTLNPSLNAQPPTRSLGSHVHTLAMTIYDWILPRNEYTGSREFRLIPTCVEQLTGYFAYPFVLRISGGVVKKDNLRYGHFVQMVHDIGKTIAAKSPRHLNFECEIVNTKQENAWCLPGGKMAITLGLIRKMEKDQTNYKLGCTPTTYEKIAAVLCHEASHAGARHQARSLEFYALLFALLAPFEAVLSTIIFGLEACDWFLTGSMLFKSRRHELEADKCGMLLLEKLGRDGDNLKLNATSPKAAIWAQHYFTANHDHSTGYRLIDWVDRLISSHPSSQERLEANKKTWEQIQNKTLPLY